MCVRRFCFATYSYWRTFTCFSAHFFPFWYFIIIILTLPWILVPNYDKKSFDYELIDKSWLFNWCSIGLVSSLILLLFPLQILVVFFCISENRCPAYANIFPFVKDDDYYNKLKDLHTCIYQAKWLICHIRYKLCILDITTNTSTWQPVCQESCYSYVNTPECQPFEKIIHLFLIFRKDCPAPRNASQNIIRFDCSIYPRYNATNPKLCHYKLKSKSTDNFDLFQIYKAFYDSSFLKMNLKYLFLVCILVIF